MIFITIALVVLAGLIGFYVGVRYAARSLLPSFLARMTPKEIGELAKRAAAERPD